jgi:hypothetical protein
LVRQRDEDVIDILEFTAVKELRKKAGQESGPVVAVGEAEDLTQLQIFLFSVFIV